MEATLSEEQKQAFQESLARGEAFEELIRTKGWGYVKAWYQNKVQGFATNLLLDEKKAIGEFEGERRELIGLRKLLGSIENDIKNLKDTVEKEKNAKKDQ